MRPQPTSGTDPQAALLQPDDSINTRETARAPHGSSHDSALLRQAVAIALVAAKRRRLQQRQGAQPPGFSSASGTSADLDSWRSRAEQAEAEVRRLRQAAATLSDAVGLGVTGRGEAAAAPPPLDSHLRSTGRGALETERKAGRANSCDLQGRAQEALLPLLLPFMVPVPAEGQHGDALEWRSGLDPRRMDGEGGSTGAVTADGMMSLERERASLAAYAPPAPTGFGGGFGGETGHLVHTTPGGGPTAAAAAKAESLSRVLHAVHSLAELSSAAAAAGGAATGGPAELHAAALRHGGTPPHAAVLTFIERSLVGYNNGAEGGSGGGGGGAANAAPAAVLAPDVCRAHLRVTVQLLAAVVHSLASKAASAAAAGAARAGTGSAGAPAAGMETGATTADRAAGDAATAAAREQFLRVCLDVSAAVDRLLNVMCGGGADAPPAAAAAAARQTIDEMLSYPALGQHVLVGAAEMVRDLGSILAAAGQAAAAAVSGEHSWAGAVGGGGGSAAAGTSVVTAAAAARRQLAAAAASFNRSRPLFDVLADCAARLPGWCAAVTAVTKPTDVGADYLASHVQALLAAHGLAMGASATAHSPKPQLRADPLTATGSRHRTAGTAPEGRFVLLYLYANAVQDCLAVTAAALMAVASGGPEFAGCGMVPACRTLCGRIKQGALLPR